MKAVWAVLVMATIWLTINSTKINNYANEQKEIDAIVQSMIEELEREKADEVVTDTFEDTFRYYRDMYGSGYVFKWENSYYTTDYVEDVVVFTDAIVGGWVLNGNDPDDWCSTNDRDECGVCGGSGPETWYADRDGDGLGHSSTSKLSCEEPSAFNQ